MRTIVTLMFFLIALHTAEAAGERSGSVFQWNEIRYFGLFPRIDSVLTATVEPLAGRDSVTIRIHRSALPDTVLAVPQQTVDALYDYTEHFEKIFTDGHTINWSQLQSLVRPIQPFIQQDPIEITTTEGTNISGFLFAATDSLILIYTGSHPLDWRTYTRDYLVSVPFYTIATADDRYIGGNKNFYISARSFLRERTMFHAIPPEASRILSSPSLVYEVPPHSLQSVELPPAYAKPRWHFAVLGGFSRSSAPVDMFNIIVNSPPGTRKYALLDPQENAIFFIGEASLSYDLSDRFHTLLTFGTFPSAEAENDPGSSAHQKSVSGWTSQLMGTFSLIRSDAFLDNPIEWQVGAGIAYTKIQVHTSLISTINPETGARTFRAQKYEYDDATDAFTPCVTSLVRYSISSLFSLQLQVSLIAPRDLSVPAHLYPPSKNDNRIGIGQGLVLFGAGLNL